MKIRTSWIAILRSLCMCPCLVYKHICLPSPTYVWLGIRKLYVPCSVAFHLIPLRQSLSLDLQLVLLSARSSVPLVLSPYSAGVLGMFVGCWLKLRLACFHRKWAIFQSFMNYFSHLFLNHFYYMIILSFWHINKNYELTTIC